MVQGEALALFGVALDDLIAGREGERSQLLERLDALKAELEPQRLEAEIALLAQKADPLAFLIVKSMLLTGFDAPIEGVMYLDRSIREAELLQAIARVNRTGHGKTRGCQQRRYKSLNHRNRLSLRPA